MAYLKKLYLLNPKFQKESIREYCLGQCGKMQNGGIDVLDRFYHTCEHGGCKHAEQIKYIGNFQLTEFGRRKLFIRRLKLVRQPNLDFPNVKIE